MKHISVIGTVILISTIFLIGCHTEKQESENVTKWKLKVDGEVQICPAISADGNIYLGTDYGKFYAVTPNGSIIWSCSFSGGASAPAVGLDGTIYCVSFITQVYYSRYLIAINSNGTLKWQYQLDSMCNETNMVSSPAIGTDSVIYVGSEHGYFYAIYADGTLKWSYQTGGLIYSSPAIGSDGTIYFGSEDKYLYALNADGTLRWRYQTGDKIWSSPAIGSDGTIYFSSFDKYLYALNSDGTLKWRYFVGDGSAASPTIGSDGTVYYVSYNLYRSEHYLFALDPNGALKWRYSNDQVLAFWVPYYPLICSDGTILTFLFDDHYKFCRVKTDGTLAGYFDAEDYLTCMPTVGTDSTLYYGIEVVTGWTTSDFYLVAIKGKGILANTPWPKLRNDLKNTGRVGGY